MTDLPQSLPQAWRPPMGWNSWDSYGTTLTEDELLANARFMAEHLKNAGWDTLVIDIDWYDPTARAHGYNDNAPLILDEYGRQLPDPVRFPSAAGGKGFGPLAAAVHELGLKLGMHIRRKPMKIKKNLVAATAAVLAAGMALAGCGSSNGGSGDVQKTADGKVKITMWRGFSEADGKTLESIVDDFNKSQDKYEIDAQLQPWSTIGETMVTKVTTGDGPDFVTTGADNGQGWSIDGTFQCVSDFYADKNNGTDDYLDNVVKQITFNIDGEEEKCAVPMGYAPTSVWYNTDMWKAAGLTDKDIPTTWDQLLEVAKKLTKSDGSQYGLAMADSGWAAYMKGNGTGLYTTDGKVSINSKENKAFLQKMRDFYNGGYAVPGLDDTAARESFESGQSAMVIVGPWEDQAATDKGINHDTFAVPDGDGTYKYADGKTGSNTGSTGLYWWVTSQVGDSEKLPGIYEFFKFYNNHDNQVKWSLGSAYPPNNKTVTADELSDRPLIAKISQYTDNSYIGIAGLKGGFGDIAASLDTLTQNTVRTGDDIQGLLDQAESSISGYLDEYAE